MDTPYPVLIFLFRDKIFCKLVSCLHTAYIYKLANSHAYIYCFFHDIRFEDQLGNIHYGQPILKGSQLTASEVSGGQLKAYLIEGDIVGDHRVTSTIVSVKKVIIDND